MIVFLMLASTAVAIPLNKIELHVPPVSGSPEHAPSTSSRFPAHVYGPPSEETNNFIPVIPISSSSFNLATVTAPVQLAPTPLTSPSSLDSGSPHPVPVSSFPANSPIHDITPAPSPPQKYPSPVHGPPSEEIVHLASEPKPSIPASSSSLHLVPALVPIHLLPSQPPKLPAPAYASPPEESSHPAIAQITSTPAISPVHLVPAPILSPVPGSFYPSAPVIPDIPSSCQTPDKSSEGVELLSDILNPVSPEVNEVVLQPGRRVSLRDSLGQFSHGFSDSNGTVVSEQGRLLNTNDDWEAVIVKKGYFSYISPDGTPVKVSYVADENGFRAIGTHIPT